MSEKVRLTQIVKCAGCAGKLAPAILSKAVHSVDWPTNENVLHGNQGNEDCGVYKISETEALVQTTDFFTPVVDDPFTFGQIAATNALSDIYAMGASPLSALNILCYPEDLDGDILSEILKGGAHQAKEANCPIVGGHSVNAPELKYGLAVTGKALIKEVVYNAGAREGDYLILTKPLGTGILNTAIKRGNLKESTFNALVTSMTTLNREAAILMQEFGIRGATDVTGFSLMGHGMEMARASKVNFEINSRELPLLPEVLDAIREGHVTRGDKSNRIYTEGYAMVEEGVEDDLSKVAFDPQTSGGLLIAVDSSKLDAFLSKLQSVCPDARVIGRCLPPESEELSGKVSLIA